MHKNREPSAPREYNRIVRVGLWLTIITAAVWGGGEIINRIAMYLPYSLGVGILTMAVGMWVHIRGKQNGTAGSDS